MNERDETPSRPGDFALDEPLPLGATEPVDVMQVRADDALIAALSETDEIRIDDPIDERLADLLRSWRDDVHAEPARPLVGIDAAAAALASSTRVRPARRPAGPFGPLATAAAVLMIAFVGLGLAARDAEPGDALWNVTKVLYSDKAKSVEAAVTVQIKLEQANSALHERDLNAAALALQEVDQKLPVVAEEDGRQQLATQAEQLKAQLGGTSTAPAPAPESPASSTSVAVATTTEPPPAPTTTNPQVETTVQPEPSAAPSASPTTGETSTAAPGAGLPGGSEPNAAPRSGSETPPAGGTESAEATSS